MNGRLIEGLAHLQEMAEEYIGVETSLGVPRHRIYVKLSELTIPPGISDEFRKDYPSPADAARAVRITFDTGLGHQMIMSLSSVEVGIRTRDQLVEIIEDALAPYCLYIQRRGV